MSEEGHLVVVSYKRDGKTYYLSMPSDHAEWAEQMLGLDLAAHDAEVAAKAVSDPLATVRAERDAALARIAELEVERDRALEGVADQRRGIARRMEDIAALEVENLDLEARIADLEQSLRSESLGRMVDATLLHEYARRFAEAAKLHRRRDDLEYRWGGGPVCDGCGDEDGWASKWPCPTAVALGLNEGENDD